MKTEEFNYDLPHELIAQVPLKNRQDSRLLVFSKETEIITHSEFKHLQNFLISGDLLVINRTRVIPARLGAIKKSGGKAEILLLKKLTDLEWEVLVGGKKILLDANLQLTNDISGVVVQDLGGPKRVMRFNHPIEAFFEKYGQMPLPPYIHKKLEDPNRYQTVYAKDPGSAAAPTAGLHFTQQAMNALKENGIEFAEITLHVGLDTFAPVNEVDVETHKIHSEWREINEKNARIINQAIQEKRRIIAVGTTSVRTLESSYRNGKILATAGPTSLFIIPGYKFKVVNGIITNFHLPKSTLIMLVSAFAGRENIMRCYREAIINRYRFFSFGDAMLIY